MKKLFSAAALSGMLCVLSSCGVIGAKTTSISVIYGATTLLSLLLLIGYCVFITRKDPWFLLLFASVFVVNAGYFTLAISQTLEEALLCNRIAYLGSVLLPLSMLMTVFDTTRLKYRRWLPTLFLAVSAGMFFVAASPGYLDIYYKSVSFARVNGVSMLVKEYGSWHSLYLFYLVGYFLAMIYAILRAIIKKRLETVSQAAILAVAVFVNICVWLIEQLIPVNFEFLSVSYIISELFLLALYLMMERHDMLLAGLEQQSARPTEPHAPAEHSMSPEFIERCEFMRDNLASLTHSERAIYCCYLAGKTTKEVMQELNIAENTLKYHNKNLYSKLGVSSRKQLLEYAKAIEELSE